MMASTALRQKNFSFTINASWFVSYENEETYIFSHINDDNTYIHVQ